jgi:hypothetical protein
VVTVKLALLRFRAEQWWDRKARAYSSIFESLHVMKRALDSDLEEEKMASMAQGANGSDDSDERESRQQWKKAMSEVLKAVDTGSFLLSQEASDALHAWEQEWNQAEKNNKFEGHLFHEGAIGDQIDAIDRCLKQLPLLARKDLNIK